MKQFLTILVLISFLSCDNVELPSTIILPTVNLQDSVNVYKSKLNKAFVQLDSISNLTQLSIDKVDECKNELWEANAHFRKINLFIAQRVVIQDSLMVQWYRDNPGVSEPKGEPYGSLRGFFNEINFYLNK